VCCVLCRMRLGYVVVWQLVLGVACVLCAVQNETEFQFFMILPWFGKPFIVPFAETLSYLDACDFRLPAEV
jgi:hypothetical protein